MLASVPAFAGEQAAQEQPAAPAPVAAATPAIAPPPAVSGSITPPVYDLPDPASLTRPEMAFTTTLEIEDDFEKFFYFHRDETDFAEAFNDIRECDALASGSNIYLSADAGSIAAASAQYGALAGALGGAIGGAIADAIFGSAARRQQRRLNLRNCMGFKGYQRYGLAEDLWKKFNFEEGHGRKKEDERNEALELQALVASGPKPTAKELGL